MNELIGSDTSNGLWLDHPAILRAGGIMDWAGATPEDQQNGQWITELFDELMDHLRSDGYLADIGPLHLVFTAQNALMISVVRRTAGHAICVSIGSIRSIWNLLVLGLCDPDLLPGYPGDEQATYMTPCSISREMLVGESIQCIPTDARSSTSIGQRITQNRCELCEQMFKSIFDYILYHEATHITRNHLTMIHIFNNEDQIDESSYVRHDEELFQLLELDADMHAMDYVVQHDIEFSELLTSQQMEVRDYFFLRAFGYILVQQLFDLEHRPMAEALKKDHPPPVFRAMIWSDSLAETIRDLNIIDLSNLRDEHNKIWYEASKIATKLSFPEGRWRGSHLRDVPFDEMKALVANYATLEAIIDQDNLANTTVGFRRYLGLSD